MNPVSKSTAALARYVRWPVFSVTSSRLVGNLVQQGVRPGFVVDAGANRGQFAVAVLELIPGSRVLSFEPLPVQASSLRALVARYSGRLETRQVALGSAQGRQ